MPSHIARTFARLFACSAAAFAAAASAGVEVNPDFPVYGQAVSVMLSDVGADPYFIATRYRRDGANIVLEVEHASGGYFGYRPDTGYVPVSLGELAPGHYNVQAKLFDISDPDAAPLLFTRGIDVAPPESPGVYSVPRNPGANEAFQLVVVADGAIDASSLRATVTDSSIRVDFTYSTNGSAPKFGNVKVPGLAPGAYAVEVFGKNPAFFVNPTRFSGSVGVDATTTVAEYYSPRLDHYFMSAWPDEMVALDAGMGFMRTGETFKAWLRQGDAPGYAVPVCRFYASGPNSHFYTADPGECQFLKSLEAKQKAEANTKGQPFGGWQFEAIAFYALAPQGGTCPANTLPVYRAYNRRAEQGDSNHRFTVTSRMRVAMQVGWADEGVAFCSPR